MMDVMKMGGALLAPPNLACPNFSRKRRTKMPRTREAIEQDIRYHVNEEARLGLERSQADKQRRIHSKRIAELQRELIERLSAPDGQQAKKLK